MKILYFLAAREPLVVDVAVTEFAEVVVMLGCVATQRMYFRC